MSETIVLKCVLLGETSVGKSSLINRFINGAFKEDFLPTIVGCYSTKEVEYKQKNIIIRYEIWDTAGQEKYRAINKIFYQDAYVVLLVYDISNKPSFEAIKNHWYQEIKENSPSDVIIVIVGNKTDLYLKEEVNEEEAKNFSKSINALFKLTSAQNGQGINELFEMIGEYILTMPNFEEFKKNNNKAKFEYAPVNKKLDVHSEKKKKKCC